MNIAIVCPACGRQEGLSFVEKVNSYSTYLCPSCSCKFAYPREYPPELYDDWYAGKSFNMSQFSAAGFDTASFVKEAHRFLDVPQLLALKWLEKNLPQGATVLDIGFGTGYFLAALSKHGFYPLGIEIVEPLVKAMQQRGFEVHQGTVDACPESWRQAQAVTLFALLEHLPYPIEFLRNIRHLFPQAPLLLSVPNPRGLSIVPEYLPPYHITVWTKPSLTAAFSRAGYKETQVFYPGVDPVEIYLKIERIILHRLGLLEEKTGSPTSNKKGTVFANWVQRNWRLVYQAREASKLVIRCLFLLPAIYLRWRGYPSCNMLVIAFP